MRSEKLKEQQKRYRKSMRRVSFQCSPVRDADILEHLASQGNKQGYLKDLIRRDIEASARRTRRGR